MAGVVYGYRVADQEAFAVPRLVGERFTGGIIPVDALAELAEYRNLILDVARVLWKRANPQKRRLPRRFDTDFALSLRAITDGSAVCEVVRPTPKSRPLFPQDDHFAAARDLVADAIREASSGRGIPAGFPREALSRFGPFGRRLRDGEYIQLNGPGMTDGPIYNKAVRRTLLGTSGLNYTDEADLSGVPFSIDVKAGTFGLELEGSKVFGPLGSFEAVIHEAIKDRLFVSVHATAEFDAADRVVKLLSVTQFEIVSAPLPNESADTFDAELAELGSLAAGWMDGEGEPISKALLQQLGPFLVSASEFGMPKPRLYPTLEGGVQAEWTFRLWEVSATFTPAFELILSAVGANDAEFDETLHLNEASTAETLADWLGDFWGDDND